MAKTLLLADDSPTIQRVVALTFANEDITVVPVADGELAVDAMIHAAPDIVLADIAMPGRGGYDLVDFMRHSPSLSHIPVLLLAGAFETVDAARAHAVGANGILTKPFDPAVVIGRVHELLNQASSAVLAVAPAIAEAVADATAPVASTIGPHAIDAGDGYAEMDVDDELPLASHVPPVDAAEVDRYFESVDHAFSQLTLSRRPLTGLDAHLLDAHLSAELPELSLLPVTDEPPVPVAAEPVPSTAEPVPVVAESMPMVAEPVSAAPMSLGDAFSALLAAESGTVSAPPPTPVPTPAPAPVALPQTDADALVEQVTRRVLAQLSDRVVRETVSEIVLSTAERLVREEIERITRNIS